MELPMQEMPPPPGPHPQTTVGDVRRSAPRSAVVGLALVVLGLALWALSWITIGDEAHSYAAGASAPTYVQLVAGNTYSLGLPGGVTTAAARGIQPGNLACDITPIGGAVRQLAVLPRSQDSTDQKSRKAENEIATFVSPVTGRVHVGCPGLPAVFVDNAEDAAYDWSGLCLLLATAALVVGLPLLLAGVLGATGPASRDAQLRTSIA